jgi:hypothetical protein
MAGMGNKKLAFALGGIGGSNAHGIGFLQAARERNLRPDMLSCTSGMIHWAWRWLEGADLREEVTLAAEAAPFRGALTPLNWMIMATRGLEGVFEPAWNSYMRRLFQMPPPMSTADVLDRMFPAQICVPKRSAADFKDIAACFNRQSFPVMFNSFDPSTGCEYVHANEAARSMLDDQGNRHGRLKPRDPAEHARIRNSLPKVAVVGIDADAVRDALWLTAYGFEATNSAAPRQRIDGAYVRQFLLNELTAADVVLTVRPQSYHFEGRLPRNQFEVKDLETEMWFNGPYAQQVARIDLINRLVDDGKILPPHSYHHVDIVPIEIDVQRGYFSYFFEDVSVFDDACTVSKRVIDETLARYAAKGKVKETV